jgi:hypothetical protein
VQFFEGQHDATHDEPDGWLTLVYEDGEPVGVGIDEGVEISSLGPLHGHVVVLIVSKHEMQVSYEPRLTLLHDVLLILDMLQQSFLLHEAFLHALDGILSCIALASVLLQLTQEDLAEVALAQLAVDVEVLPLYLFDADLLDDIFDF